MAHWHTRKSARCLMYETEERNKVLQPLTWKYYSGSSWFSLMEAVDEPEAVYCKKVLLSEP